MIRLRETVRVQRSVGECFRYLLDFSTIEQWDPGVYRARKLTDGVVVPGTKFELQLQLPSRRVTMHYTLLEAVAPKQDHSGLLRLQGEADGIHAFDEISLWPQGSETRIEYVADLQWGAVPGVLEWAASPWLSRVGAKAIDGLRGALNAAPDRLTPGFAGSLANRLILPAALNFTERGYLRMQNKAHSQFMDGKTVVITGPTAGIGLAAACELSRLGARLVLVGRGRERLQEAAQCISRFSGVNSSNLRLIEADLLELAQVRRAAHEIAESESRVDVVINNAGALFAERAETVDGYERALAINLLAPVTLTQCLMSKLEASCGRVINVASGGMYLQGLKISDMGFEHEDYDGAKAYARAKRGLVVKTQHWAATQPQVSFHAMHPGWAATPGVAKSLPAFDKAMKGRLRDSRMGADTIVWLASSATPTQHSGAFWFDRCMQPTSVLPGTATDQSTRTALLNWLDKEVLEP